MAAMNRADLKAAGYYAPTHGDDIGHWNVFPVGGASTLNVPYGDLPEDVRRYMAGAA